MPPPSSDADDELESNSEGSISDFSSSSRSPSPCLDRHDFDRLRTPSGPQPSRTPISMPITPAQFDLHRTHALATLQNYMRMHWEQSNFKRARRQARLEDDSNAEVIRRTGGTGWECRRLMSPEMEERESGLVPWGPMSEGRDEGLSFPSFEDDEEAMRCPWLVDADGSAVSFVPGTTPSSSPSRAKAMGPPIPLPNPQYTPQTDPLPPPRGAFRLDTRKCMDPRAPPRPVPWSNDWHEAEEPSEYVRDYWAWAGREYGYTEGDERMKSGEEESAEDQQDAAENKPASASWISSLPVNLPWPFRR